MSYILDALQRADAERARGTVPGLHTSQLAGAASQGRRGTSWRLWSGVAAAIVLGGSAAALWLLPVPAGEPRRVKVNPIPVPSTAPALSTAQALPLTRQRAEMAPAASSTFAPAPLAAAPALVAPAPQPNPAALPLAGRKASPVSSTAAPLLAELGEERRRQIPALTITGAVFSDVPAQRMLLVNGLVLKQGDSAAPDLMLEEIGSSVSVFSYRGDRFRVAH